MSVTASVVHSDPDIFGGTPVFVGTRVPVRTLLDYLEAGDSLGDFLEDFPSVTREQAVCVLRLAGERLGLPICLTDPQKREFDRRIAELDANPQNVLTWEDIKARV